MKAVLLLFLLLVVSCSSGPVLDPCSNTLPWHMAEGTIIDHLAWEEATLWWEAAGARFEERRDGAQYIVLAKPGVLRDYPYVGVHTPVMGRSQIMVDTEKLGQDFYTEVAVMAHEIGHSFGFDHVPLETDSVMNTGRYFGDMRELPAHDKALLAAKCGR